MTAALEPFPEGGGCGLVDEPDGDHGSVLVTELAGNYILPDEGDELGMVFDDEPLGIDCTFPCELAVGCGSEAVGVGVDVAMVDLGGVETGEDLTSGLLPNVNNIVTYMPSSRSFYTVYGTNYGKLIADTLIRTQTTAKSVPAGGTPLDPQTVEGQNLVLSMYVIDTEHENSKLIVFGSSDFLTDEGAGNAYFINPLQLFLTSSHGCITPIWI